MEPYLLGNPGVLTRPFILLNVCMQRDVNTFSVPNFIGYFCSMYWFISFLFIRYSGLVLLIFDLFGGFLPYFAGDLGFQGIVYISELSRAKYTHFINAYCAGAASDCCGFWFGTGTWFFPSKCRAFRR